MWIFSTNLNKDFLTTPDYRERLSEIKVSAFSPQPLPVVGPAWCRCTSWRRSGQAWRGWGRRRLNKQNISRSQERVSCCVMWSYKYYCSRQSCNRIRATNNNNANIISKWSELGLGNVLIQAKLALWAFGLQPHPPWYPRYPDWWRLPSYTIKSKYSSLLLSIIKTLTSWSSDTELEVKKREYYLSIWCISI